MAKTSEKAHMELELNVTQARKQIRELVNSIPSVLTPREYVANSQLKAMLGNTDIYAAAIATARQEKKSVEAVLATRAVAQTEALLEALYPNGKSEEGYDG